MKAMLFAAGFGTRLKPFTNNHPKALAQVNGKTLLQRNIEYLQQFGIYEVVVNAHHFADQIIQAINENNGWGSKITISDETDNILETGGGLQRASWYFRDEDYLMLMNTDILTSLPLNDMIAYHNQNKPLATLATTNRQTSRYFLFNEDAILCGWENIKTGEQKIKRSSVNLTQKAFSGIHIINTKIFELIHFSEIKFSMVDLYLDLCSSHNIISYDHSSSKLIDVGTPESLIKAASMFK